MVRNIMPVVKGIGLGMVGLVLVLLLTGTWLIAAGEGTYFLSYFLWGVWLTPAFLAGLYSGSQAIKEGWSIGLLTGFSYGIITAGGLYLLSGWMGYSIMVAFLAAVLGFLGGAMGINIRHSLHRRRLGRRRMFMKGWV